MLRSTLIVGCDSTAEDVRKGRHKPTQWIASLWAKAAQVSRGGLAKQVCPHRWGLMISGGV